MELLVDREIAGAAEAFAAFGDVRLFDGRTLRPADLGEAGILLVRSVTRVDAALLDASGVRFVGTATAGIDHVDTRYLDTRAIAFAHAAGCNARAVAEHVLCCLDAYAAERAAALGDLRVGIVGYGQVGSALGTLLGALGIAFVVNDPPRGRDIAGVASADLESLLDCDVLTLHVPLSTEGAHPTRDLIDAGRVARLRKGALVINTARGGVLDERAVLQRIRRRDLYAAIDCWRGEPAISAALSRQAWQASPHIAGHTLEARVNASVSLQRAVGTFLGIRPSMPQLLTPNPLCLNEAGGTTVGGVLDTVHSIAALTARMRELADLASAERAARFDAIRRAHGLRREFASFSVAPAGLDIDTVACLRALGFAVEAAADAAPHRGNNG